MRTENYVIAATTIATNKVSYYAIVSEDNKAAFKTSPMEFVKCFNHDDAAAIVRAMRLSGEFDKNETVLRVKTLAQSMRDYCWEMICDSKANMVQAGTEAVETVKAMYPAPVKEKKVETVDSQNEQPVEEVAAETTVEEVAEEVSTEVAEPVVEETKKKKSSKKSKQTKVETAE